MFNTRTRRLYIYASTWRKSEENGNIQDESNSSFQLTLEDLAEDLAQRVAKIVILFVELQFNFE